MLAFTGASLFFRVSQLVGLDRLDKPKSTHPLFASLRAKCGKFFLESFSTKTYLTIILILLVPLHNCASLIYTIPANLPQSRSFSNGTYLKFCFCPALSLAYALIALAVAQRLPHSRRISCYKFLRIFYLPSLEGASLAMNQTACWAFGVGAKCNSNRKAKLTLSNLLMHKLPQIHTCPSPGER